MTKLQFRVLYRQFLFRMVDLELLSAHAQGDVNKLLGQFAALLVMVSVGLAIPAMGVDSIRSPQLRLFLTWSMEHFLIATTMLVVGLFAVLSWDSTFPDRRDVLVLAPLPVRARTLFLAKVAAAGTALSLTVVILHAAAGLAWPLALDTQAPAQTAPSLTWDPAIPPVDAAGMQSVLNRDLQPPAGAGLAIGVWKHGVRRVFAYGTAKSDSIFEIASISKTFTALLLAQMAKQGKVRFDEPVRELLPAETVAKPKGNEITLLDLATHHSGLPPLPGNLRPNVGPNPGADYHAGDLYEFLAKHGLARPVNPPFVYSNLGFGLLGQALVDRAGTTYATLLASQITGPLGMRDTAVSLSPEQQGRLIQAYDREHRPVPPWDLDALAGAGAIRSTAGDMLNYLEANLHPEKLSAGTLSTALQESHQLRAEVMPGMHIALAWFYDAGTGTYWHDGLISGYTSYAFFNPKGDYASIILFNQAPELIPFTQRLGQHIRQRFEGKAAISLASVTVPANGGILRWIRWFAVYWITMLAAGAFIFCCVLAVQGLAAQLLPRRLFLRASSFLQLAAFCLFVSVYFLQPNMATPPALLHAQGDGLLAWSPSYWFLGLLQTLNGSAALAPLAQRAWIALSIAASATALAYALSYFRTLRKIAEEPDITAGGTGFSLGMPRFGNALQTAIVQFSVRTLFRSRQHRLILAFYLGIALALTIFFLRNQDVPEQLPDAPVTEPWRQANLPILISTIAVMVLCIVGTRTIFSIPLDLRANWIFRIAAIRGGPECLAASRRSLLLLSVAPVWLASAVFCLWLWPWQQAALHLAALALIGFILVELCLHGFQKIPFTCSYLPGKSQLNLAFIAAAALLQIIGLSARYERQVLEEPARFAVILLVLVITVVCARWRTASTASSGEPVQFEEEASPAILTLGLNRDGVVPTGPPIIYK